MLNFVFERFEDTPMRARTNMAACTDRIAGNDHSSDWPRFSESGLLAYLSAANFEFSECTLDDRPARYVYATSTYNGPHYWAGWSGNDQGFRSLFEFIPDVVCNDCRSGHAVLLIDQLMEGYSHDSLYEFFHAELERLSLPARCLIYVSGNHRESQRYHRWLTTQDQKQPIVMLSLPHLEFISRGFFQKQIQLNWQDYAHHLNQSTTRPLLYNCLNRVNRYHRNLMFMHLWQANLLEHGLVSCEKLDWAWHLAQNGWSHEQIAAAKSCLPRIIDFNDFNNNPAMDIAQHIYQHTRISVITETLGDDAADQLFVTEKPFKSIYMLHPFMVLGQQGHLAQLRDWGYETFGDFWDESYDHMPNMAQRAAAITANLCQLRDSRDLYELHRDLRHILEHNQNNFLSRSADTPYLRTLIQALYAALDN
jgi:hypothetical protein